MDSCKTQPFTILCDESNARDYDKLFAILVRVFEEELRSVKTRFLNMPVVNVGTGANLYAAFDKCLRYLNVFKILVVHNYTHCQLSNCVVMLICIFHTIYNLINTFSSRGIPWENVMAFCSDNCSAMHLSVFSISLPKVKNNVAQNLPLT